MKHTPGPWAFCNDTLCQANGKYLHIGKWTESCGLGKAAESNKRLIEAAPDMIEALQKALLHMLTGHKLSDADSEAAWAHIHKAEDIARVAIAKATGE